MKVGLNPNDTRNLISFSMFCGKWKEKEIIEYLEILLKEPLHSYSPIYKKIDTSLIIPFFSSRNKPTIKFIKKTGYNQNLTFMVFRFVNFYF